MNITKKAKQSQSQGYMFEVVIRHLLSLNGFSVMTKNERGRVRAPNKYNVEIKGRGTWHQIDAPCLYCNRGQG